MNKNHMKEVAAILGLKLGEEFQLKNDENNRVYVRRYRITEDELEYFDTECSMWNHAFSDEYKFLMTGRNSIVKKTWRPKSGEKYFIPTTTGGNCDCTFLYWRNYKVDENLYKANMVCKTEEEAVKKAECMLQALRKYNETEE